MSEILWSDRKRWTFFALPFTFTKYSMSEDRFFISRGFLNKSEDEVRLYRITDVSLKRSFGQRIFGLGTILVSSGDKTLRDFEIKNIKNSKDVKEQLSELVDKQRDAKRVSGREFIDGPDEFDEV
ncbi:MAG: PH domain-containing protein [Lachnospiraceae bacterium]|nr:PH domain-containing protein [Lachnospiraceae bacterium]